jgi:hypothetical protein
MRMPADDVPDLPVPRIALCAVRHVSLYLRPLRRDSFLCAASRLHCSRSSLFACQCTHDTYDKGSCLVSLGASAPLVGRRALPAPRHADYVPVSWLPACAFRRFASSDGFRCSCVTCGGSELLVLVACGVVVAAELRNVNVKMCKCAGPRMCQHATRVRRAPSIWQLELVYCG